MAESVQDSTAAGAMAASLEQDEAAKLAAREKRKSFCKKCKGPNICLLLRLTDAYCKDCFLYSVQRKVRGDMGKHRVFNQFEKVLMCYSGGNRSSALLQLIHDYRQPNQRRQLRIEPVVLHIDESAAGVHAPPDHYDIIKTRVAKYGFPQLDIVSLASVFGQESSEENERRLQQLLASCKTRTARDDLVRLLKRQIIVQFARASGVSKVMLGDCNDRLAMRILTEVAHGRGGSMNHLTTFMEEIEAGVYFVRPLRQVSCREIGLFNHYRSTDPIVWRHDSTGAPSKSSFEKLTEEFVSGLVAGFPSTCSAVFRISGKVELASKDVHAECVFCQSAVEPMATAQALLTSRTGLVEGSSAAYIVKRKQLLGQDTTADPDEDVDLSAMVCYACRSNLLDMDMSAAVFPPSFAQDQAAAQEMGQADMATERLRSQIQEFLLDDEDEN